MRFFAEALGAIAVETKFNRMGADALNARPAMDDVADQMMEAIDKNFKAQGRRGGGSWKKVTSQWAARKARNGLDPRILHATLALRESMTERGNVNQKLVVRRDRATLGTKLPYAKKQNRERQFNYFLRGDIDQMRATIRRHLLRAWRRRNL